MSRSRKPYHRFLRTASRKQWDRIGLERRAGVATPLFSIYSSRSIGIGEIPDLKLLIDWCQQTGMSLIQLLPLNDVGFHFRSYDADSAFALDPMYLSLEHIRGVDIEPFRPDIELLRRAFPAGEGRVNYEVKGEKLRLLWKIFLARYAASDRNLDAFRMKNQFWLCDYAFFKVLKQLQHQRAWQAWPEAFARREKKALQYFSEPHRLSLRFHEWQQWQLYEQMKEVRSYARARGVFLMGDLPLLVSSDSADVWSRPNYFKLDQASGAPPDRYFPKGQRWGMPVYNWEEIKKDRYRYLKEKLKYAANFYDLFRIDHAVGLFRIWSIPANESLDHHGMNGAFDPPRDAIWAEHGRKLLSVMLKASSMIPCAEDLGTIPQCTFDVIDELGILGTDVQRWQKDSKKNYAFKPPGSYRANAVAILSNHDMASLVGWWEFESGTVNEILFERACAKSGVYFHLLRHKLFDLKRSHHGRLRWKPAIGDKTILIQKMKVDKSGAKEAVDLYLESFDEQRKFWRFLGLNGKVNRKISPALVESAFRMVHAAKSIFSIQFLTDCLSLDRSFRVDVWKFRINFPGTVSEDNWSLVMPFSLEKMLTMKANAKIKALNAQSKRI